MAAAHLLANSCFLFLALVFHWSGVLRKGAEDLRGPPGQCLCHSSWAYACARPGGPAECARGSSLAVECPMSPPTPALEPPSPHPPPVTAFPRDGWCQSSSAPPCRLAVLSNPEEPLPPPQGVSHAWDLMFQRAHSLVLPLSFSFPCSANSYPSAMLSLVPCLLHEGFWGPWSPLFSSLPSPCSPCHSSISMSCAVWACV